jgi:hypothetical protein
MASPSCQTMDVASRPLRKGRDLMSNPLEAPSVPALMNVPSRIDQAAPGCAASLALEIKGEAEK